METTGITVNRIEAVNVLKFEAFQLTDLSKLTLISGANQQGKTTVLRLLGLCFAGSDADSGSVLHDGAERGAISIGLTNGYTLRRTFTMKRDYFDVFDEQGHKVPSPQTWVSDRIGEFSDFNPLAWLSMPAKDQVRVLLQAVDVRLTPAEFRSVTAMTAPLDVDFEQHGLLALDALRTYYADERKDQNRVADQKRKAAAELRVILPSEAPEVSADRRDAADAALANARTSVQTLEARRLAATQHASAVRQLTDSINRADAEVHDLDIENHRLRNLIAKNEEKQQQIRTRQTVMRVDLTGLATTAPPTNEEVGIAQAALTAAEATLAGIARDEVTLGRFADAARIEQEASDAAVSASLTDVVIKTIDTDLRTTLMAKAALPVEDLTITDGRILIGGHELQFLAESIRIRIAVAIARALRPALRVIVLDGTEQLDAATFTTFLQEIHGDGFVYLATEVNRAGGALEIIQFGETEAGIFRLPAPTTNDVPQLQGVA